MTLYGDGTLSMAWQQVDIPDGMVGISRGAMNPVVQQDFSDFAGGTCTFQQSVLQQWYDPAFPCDMQGTRLTFTPLPNGYYWYR